MFPESSGVPDWYIRETKMGLDIHEYVVDNMDTLLAEGGIKERDLWYHLGRLSDEALVTRKENLLGRLAGWLDSGVVPMGNLDSFWGMVDGPTQKKALFKALEYCAATGHMFGHYDHDVTKLVRFCEHCEWFDQLTWEEVRKVLELYAKAVVAGVLREKEYPSNMVSTIQGVLADFTRFHNVLTKQKSAP